MLQNQLEGLRLYGFTVRENTSRGSGFIFETFIGILEKCVLFKGITPSEIAQMLNCLSPRGADYAKGGLVAQASGPMQEIGIVLDGAVAVTKETPLGERIVLNKIQPGGIFGEVAALSDLQRSPATIFALEKSTVMFIRPSKILMPCSRTCRWHTLLTENLIHIVADRALYLNRKIDFLTIKSMRGKLCTYLFEQYRKSGKQRFTLPYNRNELADFLNVSRPSMSRELGRMRDEGILAFRGDSFELLDVEKLKSFVQ